MKTNAQKRAAFYVREAKDVHNTRLKCIRMLQNKGMEILERNMWEQLLDIANGQKRLIEGYGKYYL